MDGRAVAAQSVPDRFAGVLRPYSAADVLRLTQATGDAIPADALRAAMTPAERASQQALAAEISARTAQMQELQRTPGASTAWADFAHALCNQKEFLYLR